MVWNKLIRKWKRYRFRLLPRYRRLRRNSVFFLNGVPALPPPLKKEEEELAGFDETVSRLRKEQSEIFEKYMEAIEYKVT